MSLIRCIDLWLKIDEFLPRFVLNLHVFDQISLKEKLNSEQASEKNLPGNSAGALFGMVSSRDLFF